MANVLDKIARFPKIRAGYIREIAPASAGQGLNIVHDKIEEYYKRRNAREIVDIKSIDIMMVDYS